MTLASTASPLPTARSILLKSSHEGVDKETIRQQWHNDSVIYQLNVRFPKGEDFWSYEADARKQSGVKAREVPFVVSEEPRVKHLWEHLGNMSFDRVMRRAREFVDEHGPVPPPRPWEQTERGQSDPDLISNLLHSTRDSSPEEIEIRLKSFMGSLQEVGCVAEGLLYWGEYALDLGPQTRFEEIRDTGASLRTRLNNFYLRNRSGHDYMRTQEYIRSRSRPVIMNDRMKEYALHMLTDLLSRAREGKRLVDGDDSIASVTETRFPQTDDAEGSILTETQSVAEGADDISAAQYRADEDHDSEPHESESSADVKDDESALQPREDDDIDSEPPESKPPADGPDDDA